MQIYKPQSKQIFTKNLTLSEITSLTFSGPTGYIVVGSISNGTGTNPCFYIIVTISGILIPDIKISDPLGKFLAYKHQIHMSYLEI